MYIIIFSRNYACSIWHLQELRHIIEHSEITGRKVIPLYYNVEPQDLQLQAETLGDTIAETCDYSDNSILLDSMENCRVSLTTAVELPGCIIDDTRYSEAQIVEDLVQELVGIRLNLSGSGDRLV